MSWGMISSGIGHCLTSITGTRLVYINSVYKLVTWHCYLWLRAKPFHRSASCSCWQVVLTVRIIIVHGSCNIYGILRYILLRTGTPLLSFSCNFLQKSSRWPENYSMPQATRLPLPHPTLVFVTTYSWNSSPLPFHSSRTTTALIYEYMWITWPR